MRQGLLYDRPDCGEGVKFLQPAVLVLVEILRQFGAVLIGALKAEQQRHLESLGGPIAQFHSFDKVQQLKRDVAVLVGYVVAAYQFLVVQVVA